jgi:hypothetical protein
VSARAGPVPETRAFVGSRPHRPADRLVCALRLPAPLMRGSSCHKFARAMWCPSRKNDPGRPVGASPHRLRVEIAIAPKAVCRNGRVGLHAETAVHANDEMAGTSEITPSNEEGCDSAGERRRAIKPFRIQIGDMTWPRRQRRKKAVGGHTHHPTSNY